MNTFSEKLGRKLKRYTDFSLPIVALIFVVFLIPFQLFPNVKASLAVKEEIRLAVEHKNQLEEKAKFLSSQDYEVLKEKLEKVNRAVPTMKDIPSIFANISMVGKKSSVNVDLIQINAGEISTSSGVTESAIEFQVIVTGSSEQIQKFLKEATVASRLFYVKSGSFRQTVKSGNQTSGQNASLIMNAYFQPLPESIGKIDDPIIPLTTQEEKIIAAFVDNEQSVEFLPSLPVGKTNPFSRF